MILTSNEDKAMAIAKEIAPSVQETVWRTSNLSPLMTAFTARPRVLRNLETRLTATMHGGMMSLWFEVDRITWFGLRRTPVADVFSIGGDWQYDVLSSLFRLVTGSPTTVGL